MISVIIPAHNEGNTIQECIDRLKIKNELKMIEVIVVCNGCTDLTPQICRRNSNIITIESDIPSKVNALNIGDQNAKYYPRFYLDADVIVDGQTLIDTAKNMVEGGFLVGAPRMDVDYNNRIFLIRNYYKVWLSTPYCKNAMVGSGLYGVTEEGHARFSKFPELISDDGYIRLLFNENERYVYKKGSFLVTVPYTLKGLFSIKIRAHLGNMELEYKFPELKINENTNNKSFLVEQIKKPKKYLPVFSYFVLKIIMRLSAKRKFIKKDFTGWNRDESARMMRHQNDIK